MICAGVAGGGVLVREGSGSWTERGERAEDSSSGGSRSRSKSSGEGVNEFAAGSRLSGSEIGVKGSVERVRDGEAEADADRLSRSSSIEGAGGKRRPVRVNGNEPGGAGEADVEAFELEVKRPDLSRGGSLGGVLEVGAGTRMGIRDGVKTKGTRNPRSGLQL